MTHRRVVSGCATVPGFVDTFPRFLWHVLLVPYLADIHASGGAEGFTDACARFTFTRTQPTSQHERTEATSTMAPRRPPVTPSRSPCPSSPCHSTTSSLYENLKLYTEELKASRLPSPATPNSKTKPRGDLQMPPSPASSSASHPVGDDRMFTKGLTSPVSPPRASRPGNVAAAQANPYSGYYSGQNVPVWDFTIGEGLHRTAPHTPPPPPPDEILQALFLSYSAQRHPSPWRPPATSPPHLTVPLHFHRALRRRDATERLSRHPRCIQTARRAGQRWGHGGCSCPLPSLALTIPPGLPFRFAAAAPAVVVGSVHR